MVSYKRSVIFILLMLFTFVIADDVKPPSVLPERSMVSEEYDKAEEQRYRDNIQLTFKEIGRDIKSLEKMPIASIIIGDSLDNYSLTIWIQAKIDTLNSRIDSVIAECCSP